MNRRSQEFAYECSHLLEVIVSIAQRDASGKGVTAYDVDVDKDEAFANHKSLRFIATDDAVFRHFDNLRSKNLFVESENTLRLNPQWANLEVDFLVRKIRMPKN